MKTKSKTKKLTYTQLEKVALQLEKRIIWALKFMRAQGSGVVATVNYDKDGGIESFGESQHWTRWFADGAEMLGRYKIDRELLGLSKKEYDKVLKDREKLASARTVTQPPNSPANL